MSDTNAVKWLHTQGVAFDVLEYEFTEIGADHAAEGVGLPLEMVCKTLIVEAPGQVYWVAIIPGDQRFNPQLTAKAIGAKHVELAEQTHAEKVTGYRVGGISPFATRRHLPVIIEEGDTPFCGKSVTVLHHSRLRQEPDAPPAWERQAVARHTTGMCCSVGSCCSMQ